MPGKFFFLRIRVRRWWSDKVYRLRCDVQKFCGRCERCSTKPAKLTPSCTNYSWDGKGRDPNAPILLCRDCAEEYIAHWDEMWHDYYSSQGYG